MLWIDVTDTFLRWTGGPTGIQRTLVGLAEASRSNPDCGLCVRDEGRNTWRRLPAESFITYVREPLALHKEGAQRGMLGRFVDNARGFGKSLYNFSSCHFWLFHDWARDRTNPKTRSMSAKTSVACPSCRSGGGGALFANMNSRASA